MVAMSEWCRLCLREGPLLRSHILPEFVFRPLYRQTTTYEPSHATTRSWGGSTCPGPSSVDCLDLSVYEAAFERRCAEEALEA
jgi:hypothetical protein